MEIFEKIGDAASKTYKFTAEKTSKIAKETKIKMQINEYKSDIKDIYMEIGETVYRKHIMGEEINLQDLKQSCEEIDNISDKITKSKDELLSLKNRKQCENCYEEIQINANYCPNCGFEQDKEVSKEEKKDIVIEDIEKAEENLENEEVDDNNE